MAYAWQCDRCKHIVPPRGGLAPRFCPRCGGELGGAPVEAPSPSAPFIPYRPRPGSATAAMILGIASFIPGFGLPLGIIAVVLAAAAQGRIEKSRGALRGEGLATAGIVLGLLGVVYQIALWARIG